jgi:hypothetical protein
MSLFVYKFPIENHGRAEQSNLKQCWEPFWSKSPSLLIIQETAHSWEFACWQRMQLIYMFQVQEFQHEFVRNHSNQLIHYVSEKEKKRLTIRRKSVHVKGQGSKAHDVIYRLYNNAPEICKRICKWKKMAWSTEQYTALMWICDIYIERLNKWSGRYKHITKTVKNTVSLGQLKKCKNF